MVPSFEFRDGHMVEVEDVVIRESTTITEPVSRTLVIENGATVVTRATVTGTVAIKDGHLIARGTVSGTVSISPGSDAEFHSRASGTLHIHAGAQATIAAGAVALGTMRVDGRLTNAGTRGVQVSGAGTIDDLPGSTVRQPDERTPDGGVVYRN